MAYSVGDTVTLDGIESLIVYDAGSEQSWGRYLCVDKNHDLVWYFEGNDCVDENLPIEEAQYGYEWGGYSIETNTESGIGKGLLNTNNLISLNLQPETENWPVIWNKIKEFRNQKGSNKWFLPNKDELNLIYNNRNSLINLSLETCGVYWSSSEFNNINAYVQIFKSGTQLNDFKRFHYNRARLCRYTTDSELNSWVSNETLSKDKLNRMETNLSSINSSYQITNWQDNDIVTADKLNKLEQGLKEVKSDYTEHTWVDGEEITATKLNNISLNI